MFKTTTGGVEISLYIQPGASKTEIIGEHNGALKVKIKSPPVDGKANDEVIRFLSELLKIRKNQIEIIKGEKSREKKILIQDCSLDQVSSALISTSMASQPPKTK